MNSIKARYVFLVFLMFIFFISPVDCAKKKLKNLQEVILNNLPVNTENSANASEKRETLKMEVYTQSNLLKIKLTSPTKPGMVVFEKDEHTYLIFDNKYNITFSDSHRLSKIISKFNVIDDKNVSIIDFQLNPKSSFYIEEIDNNFYITFYINENRYLIPSFPTSTINLEKNNPSTLELKPVKEGKSILLELDGSLYNFITSKKIDGGVNFIYKTPYYEIVPTIQGVAIQYQSQSDNIKYERDTVYIQDIISNTEKTPTKEDLYQGPFDIDPSRNLQQERAKIIEEQKNKASPYPINQEIYRAWIEIELGQGQEAQAILFYLKTLYPKIIDQNLFKILMGMSLFLQKEYQAALDWWGSLPDTLELRIWKGFCFAALGNVKALIPYLPYVKKTISYYSDFLKQEFVFLSFKVANSVGDARFRNELIDDSFFQNKIEAITFLFQINQAKTLIMNKDLSSALSLLKSLNNTNMYSLIPLSLRAEAKYLAVMTGLSLLKLSQEEALKELQHLRFEWRGDLLEYNVTKDIIKLFQGQKKLSETLGLLKDLKRLYPLESTVELLDNDMQKILAEYFKSNEKISPLKMISFYNEFLDYIPEGPNGEEIIKKVSEQFEKVDLLDESAELLTKSIAGKPDSPEKRKILFQIAQIHLDNGKFDAALAVLDAFTHDIPLNENIKVAIMKANAYVGLKKTNEAINILSSVYSSQTLYEMGLIYIKREQWKEAADKLSLALALLDNIKDIIEKKKVLNELAKVYYLSDQKDKLYQLGEEFKGFMKEEKNFLFLTQGQRASPQNREEVVSLLNKLDELKKYSE